MSGGEQVLASAYTRLGRPSVSPCLSSAECRGRVGRSSSRARTIGGRVGPPSTPRLGVVDDSDLARRPDAGVLRAWCPDRHALRPSLGRGYPFAPQLDQIVDPRNLLGRHSEASGRVSRLRIRSPYDEGSLSPRLRRCRCFLALGMGHAGTIVSGPARVRRSTLLHRICTFMLPQYL